jgi:type I restriction enzyme, S subunit
MLPKGWEKVTVGEVFNVQLGKMLNKDAKTKEPQHPYLTNFNVRWGAFNTSLMNTMYFSDREKEKFSLLNGDLILCEGGEVGRCAIWHGQVSPCYYQKALHRLRSKGKIIPSYFQFVMQSIAGTKSLDDFTSRTSIAHLTQEKLIELPVRLPPLSEQKKIAQILSAWDKAITTTEQLLANCQQLKKVLMQQLLTGKKRFPGFTGEWKFGTFDELFIIANDKKTQIYSSDYLAEGNVPIVDQGQKPIAGYTNKTEIYREIPIIVFGDHTRIVKWIDFPFAPGADGTQIIKSKPSLKIKLGYYLIVNCDIPNLGYSRHMRELKEKDFKYPTDLKEQQKITAVLTAADREIEILQKKIDCLKQEKKALMQQLLTGKRRVKAEVN